MKGGRARSATHARSSAPAGDAGPAESSLAASIVDALRRSGALSWTELAGEICRPEAAGSPPIARWRVASALGGLMAMRSVVRLGRPDGMRYGLAPGVREERCWVRPG